MSSQELLTETFSYALVIGSSIFGILWGVVNIFLVSFASIKFRIDQVGRYD
jgi:hypothetical protein